MNLAKSLQKFARLNQKVQFKYFTNLNLESNGTTFKASDLQIKLTDQRRPIPQWKADTLNFGVQETDHILVCDWDLETGWGKPIIQKFEHLDIHPFNSTLHYAIQCFEGTKAFRTEKGIRLFRPEASMFRLKESCETVALPDFDGAELQKCIEELVKLEQDWVPALQGFSLYIRPTVIAMEASLGIKIPSKARIFTIVSPVGQYKPYYPTGFNPVKLYCDPDNFRAAPMGNGNKQIGGNYGPNIQPSSEAAQKGFQQVLWLWKDQIGQVGHSNVFFLWKNEQGEEELVTPGLDDGCIVPGVTRDTILDIARSWGRFKVTERQIMMSEVAKAIDEGRLIEAFCTGTAVIVCPIEGVHYKGKDYEIPINSEFNSGNLAKELQDFIEEIQYGKRDYKNFQTDITL